MQEPLVSVVLPTYNRASLLKRAAASVLTQDYKNLELIVVDDASEENISAAVAELNDPRARCIRRETNGGAGAARNTGIQAALGSYIAFQDSDDLWLPGKLRKQVDALASAAPETAFVYTDIARSVDNASTTYPGDLLRKKAGDLHDEALGFGLLFSYTQSWLARKSALLEIGLFDPSFKRWEDWDLCIRLTHRFRVAYIPGVYVSSQRMADSITSDATLSAPAMRKLIEKHALQPAQHSKGAARLCYLLARFEFLYGTRSEGWRPLRRSLVIRPSLRSIGLCLLALLHVEKSVILARQRIRGP